MASHKPPKRPEHGRILVIDDSELVLASVAARLAREGFEVITSTQPVGNARHLRTCDLVIIDFHMPGIDGGAVLSSLRTAAADSKSNCLFFMYTSDASLVGRHQRYGFDGSFIHKGDLESLVQQVRTALRVVRLRGLKKRGRSAE